MLFVAIGQRIIFEDLLRCSECLLLYVECLTRVIDERHFSISSCFLHCTVEWKRGTRRRTLFKQSMIL